MAIRTFNSVGGFSVGEIPANIILANGDITTTHATLTGNLTAANVKTDHLLYANGTPWDLQEAAGVTGQIQFNSSNNFAASGNLTFVDAAGGNPAQFTVSGNIESTDLVVTNNANIQGNITASNFIGNVVGNISGNLTIDGGYDTGVVFLDGTSINSVSGFTFNKNSNLVTMSGNLEVSDIDAGNAVSANYFIGTFDSTSSSQPNITSVGTLTGLSVNGYANVKDLQANGVVKFTDSQFSNTAIPFFSTGGQVVADTTNFNYDDDLTQLNVPNVSADKHIFESGLNQSILYLDADSVAVTDEDFYYDADPVSQTLYSPKIVASGLITGGDFFTSGHANIGEYANVHGNINAYANINVDQNIVAQGNLSVTGWANITSNANVAGEFGVIGNANITGNINGSNNLTITGIANITGNINASNSINVTNIANVSQLKVRTDVDSNLIPSANATYNLGSDTKRWKDLWLDGSTIYLGNTQISSVNGNLVTAFANITSNLVAGNLHVTGVSNLDDDVTITGNLTVGGTTTYINVTNLAIEDPLLSVGGGLNGGNASSYDGKDRGLLLHNYDTVNDEAVNQFFGWDSSAHEFVAVANVTDLTGDVIDWDAGGTANIRAKNFIAESTFEGVFGATSSSQPNIHTIGNLTNANIDGNLKVTLTANIGTLKASGMTYPTSDGTERQVISTDGSGSLYWATIDTFNIANGTSNVTVNGPGPDHPTDPGGNVTISVAGTSNVVVVTTDGANIDGNLNVTGSFNAGAVTLTGVELGGTSIKTATLTTTNTGSGQIIVSVPVTGIRGVFFDIKGEDVSSSKFTVASITAVHDNDTTDYAVHGLLHMGGPAGSLGVTYGEDTIDLVVTPASGYTTVWTTQYRTI
jgi:cytoskeletal protein CcmA (bactofilin family)